MTAPTISGVDTARRRLQDATRALREAEQAERATRAAQVAHAGAKPFQIPRCANLDCRAPLADEQGEPRWDLLEERFVCLGRCVGRGGEGGNRG